MSPCTLSLIKDSNTFRGNVLVTNERVAVLVDNLDKRGGAAQCSFVPAVRRWLCGKPVILIENGKILQNNLRRTSITMDELTGHLREKDVLSIDQVQFAILETDGNFSVFPYPKFQPASAKDAGIEAGRQFLPITIIEDGYLFRENLALSGKDDSWLSQVLQEHQALVSTTWLLTVDKSDHIYFVPKEDTP